MTFKKYIQYTLLSASLFFSGTVLAAPTIFYSTGGQHPTPVPTLSGMMLIALSLILFIVAYRFAKTKKSSLHTFIINVLGVTALLAGTGGVTWVSEVEAVVTNNINLSDSSAGNHQAIFSPNAINNFTNSTSAPSVPITVTNIVYDGCTNKTVAHQCAVGMTLAPSAQCSIDCTSIIGDDAPR